MALRNVFLSQTCAPDLGDIGACLFFRKKKVDLISKYVLRGKQALRGVHDVCGPRYRAVFRNQNPEPNTHTHTQKTPTSACYTRCGIHAHKRMLYGLTPFYYH